MNLYYCSATSLTGVFGDYEWAGSRTQAEYQFQSRHGVWPHATQWVRGGRP